MGELGSKFSINLFPYFEMDKLKFHFDSFHKAAADRNDDKCLIELLLFFSQVR